MKTLLLIPICMAGTFVASSQTCPASTIIDGIELPVVQIRNQCFLYDTSGYFVETAVANAPDTTFSMLDQPGLTNASFHYINASVLDYVYIFSMSDCNPSEDIIIEAEVEFSAAGTLPPPFGRQTTDGTARGRFHIVRNYIASIVTEDGREITQLELENSTITRESLDIDLTNFLADAMLFIIQPLIETNILNGHVPIDDIQSIYKLNDNVIPFDPSITGPSTICNDLAITLTADEGYDSYLWSTGATSNSIVVDEPGTYSVDIAHACEAAHLSVDIAEKQVKDFIVVDLQCGNIVKLSASGFANVQWSTGAMSDTIEVSTTGLYAASVTDADGCAGTDRMFVNIHNDCLQPLTVAAECSTQPSKSRRWIINNPNTKVLRVDWEIPGTTQRSWMDVPPGVTTLTTTTAKFNTNGLTLYWHSLDGELQSVDAIGSELKCPKTIQSPFTTDARFELYPNPADDHFLIVLQSEHDGEIAFKLRSQSGNVSDEGSFEVNAGRNVIHYDASKLTKGEYIIFVGTETRRFVKN